jgi:hypothetical protein
VPSFDQIVAAFDCRVEADGFAAIVATNELGVQLLAVRVPLHVVERALLPARRCALELLPDGRVVAYLDRGEGADLARSTLERLVGDAIDSHCPSEGDDLRDLEAVFERCLEAIRAANGPG